MTEKTYLDSLGEGIVVTDLSGLTVTMNPQAEQLLGWKGADLEGKPFFDVVSLLDEQGVEVPPTFRPVFYALKSGQARTLTVVPTYYYVRKDGTRFPVGGTATPIFTDGKMQGAILVFRDITAEKEVDRAKSEFVSMAAHQLLTPLTAVSGYAHLLSDLGALSPKQVHVTDSMIGMTGRMVALVNALLNVSRIELGTFAIDPVPTDLRQLINHAIEEMKSKFDEKQIEFTAKIADDIPQMLLDPNLIGIVVQNLLTNAARYGRTGGRASLLVEKRPTVISITVSDDGIGIPADQQAKIFTKFFRATNARSMVQEGNGLGMYMVKKILDNCGGRIWFTSNPEFGTKFYVTIPLEGMKSREGDKQIMYTE